MVVAKPPLVLLHGVGMSARAWDGVVPLLSARYQVAALTIPGHRGGPSIARPAGISDLVDGVERMLDDLGFDAPHAAGNSLGGWLAIELARRGRAASVCALSPAGFWNSGEPAQDSGVKKLRREVTLSNLSRPFLPVLFRSGLVRRIGLRDIARHAERMTAAQAVAAADDLIGCDVISDILGVPDEIAPLNPLPCPVTLAWSAHDAIIPPEINGKIARERLPQARFILLPGVGHVPMIDDPALVARTISERIGRSD